MTFKPVRIFLMTSLLVLLYACGDSDDEKNLSDLHTAASLDITDISFPANIQTTHSINSEYQLRLQGLKSNGVDVIDIAKNIDWSLSASAKSTVSKNGLFRASADAEIITLTAEVGFLSESIEIKVSSAKFDQVVELNEQAFTIDMCRSQVIEPIGRYVDENNLEEIRPVDNNIINTIEWLIRNQEDNSPSQRAFIETLNNRARLHTLASGTIVIQAMAPSVYTGTEVTSVDFSQSVSTALNSIKLCLSSDTDLNSCDVTSTSIEKDKVLSFIAVGNYPATGGSSFNENISGNSKWGISNANASIDLPADRQRLNVTGEIEDSTTTLSVACGTIEQSLVGLDVSQGVTLNSAVSCASSVDCLTASSEINIDRLSVSSLDVSANGIDLTNDESINLDSRPAEISLIVNANFSNGSEAIITTDSTLDYNIIPITGQADTIEKKVGSPGVFTVLAAGTAKIQLFYRDEIFIVIIIIP